MRSGLYIVDTFTGPVVFGWEVLATYQRGEQEQEIKEKVTNLCSYGGTQEMNVLVPDYLDLVNEPKSTEIVPEMVFRDGLA